IEVSASSTVRRAVPSQTQLFARRALFAQVNQAVDEEAASACRRVYDAVAGLRVKQFDHKADDVARRAELAVFARGLNLVEHKLEDVAHQIVIGAMASDLLEQLINRGNGELQQFDFVWRQLEGAVLHRRFAH